MREPARLGDRLAARTGPVVGTSKMNPCGLVSAMLEAPVKSGPTSGPLTVSSQVIQAPHGIGPPEQFIIVPLMPVHASSTSPVRVVSMTVQPPRAFGS